VCQFGRNSPQGGAGRYRGGRGVIRDYRITSDEALVTGTFGRHKFFPWGVKGGKDGSPNYIEMIHADGSTEIFGKTARYKLRRGEVARMVTGTGGGYGGPHKRPGEEVAQDLKDEYITPEMAERDYGLAIDSRTGAMRNVRTRGRNGAATSTAPAPDVRPGEKMDAVLSILRGQTSASSVALRMN